MGIKNLRELLKTCKKGITPTKLSVYSGKTVAIDYSNSIYKFMYRSQQSGQGTWGFLDHVIDLIACLRRHNITPVIVFDNKSPDVKHNEIEKREARKQINTQKMKELIKEIKSEEPEIIKSDHLDTQIKEIKTLSSDVTKIKDLDKTTWNNITKVKKLSSQVIRPTQLHFAGSAALFRYLGIPYIKSEYEADDMCGYLYKNGLVDACMSEDTDLLAHGVGILLRNVNTYNSSLVEYNLIDIQDSLGLSTHNEFLDVCILTGTDYYKIKGLGPKGAHRLIKTYKSIDDTGLLNELCSRYKADLTTFNYKQLRSLFNRYMTDTRYADRIKGMPHGLSLSKPRFDRLFPFLMKTCKRKMNVDEIYSILNLTLSPPSKVRSA